MEYLKYRKPTKVIYTRPKHIWNSNDNVDDIKTYDQNCN